MSNQTMEFTTTRPYAYRFRAESTALIIIDMQRDFLDFGGFGQIQCGNDALFAKVRSIVPRTQAALAAARSLGLHVVHTREGHRPDLSDLPPAKRLRQISSPSGHHTMGIGDPGPMGRLLVRGEWGHDIIDELKPLPGEVIIDKPGKGSMWDTHLHRALLARGITHLLFAGVTTECCVNTTAREAADRGFECCILADCTDGFDAGFYAATLDMLCSYDGLFGFVGTSTELVNLATARATTPPETPPAEDTAPADFSLDALRAAYAAGRTRPTDVAREVLRRITAYEEKDPAVWIHRQSASDLLAAAEALEARYAGAGEPLPPLYGIPFAVKDNIDVAGIPTTAACPGLARPTPPTHAPVVAACLAAGALYIGKTNLDQLASGLSGCRSPYGTPRSIYSSARISGGSSSGSAVAVAAGLVSFALATDTAGSGRVPAAFNGCVGAKPTKGTLAARGVVPACASLDTVSVLATRVADARAVWLVCDEFGESTSEAQVGEEAVDPFAKLPRALALWHADFRAVKSGGFVFGVPPAAVVERECAPPYVAAFARAVRRLQKAGGTPRALTEAEWAPFEAGGKLLYEGALVHERVAGVGGPEVLTSAMEKGQLHPVTRDLFAAVLSRNLQPWEVFRDLQQQAQCTRLAAEILAPCAGSTGKEATVKMDVLLVPTTTQHPTVAAMAADPIALNARLGYFTHFGNVLDLCGVAVPTGMYRAEDGEEEELPFGVTLLGAAGTDGRVFDIAREFERTVG